MSNYNPQGQREGERERDLNLPEAGRSTSYRNPQWQDPPRDLDVGPANATHRTTERGLALGVIVALLLGIGALLYFGLRPASIAPSDINSPTQPPATSAPSQR